MSKEQYLDIFEKYIINEATEEEMQQLVSFIRNNPRLNGWFETQIQNSPAEISEDLKQRMLVKIQETIGKSEKRRSPVKIVLNKWIRVAASLILPLFLAFGVYRYVNTNAADKTEAVWVVSAEAGEKSNITLPDGSRVWLNSASKLTYSNTYNQKERLLKLDGEAYFEVVHDAGKAFIVQCKEMKTAVLGTTFGIKAYSEDDRMSVVLVEGKVQVTFPDKTVIMKPDERIVYDKTTQKLLLENVKSTDFTDWRKNRLRFDNETLQDIATTVSRIHNIDYTFEDEALKALKFTGTVDNTSIESVLNAITLTSPIKCTIKDSLIVFQKDERKKKYFN